MIRKVRNCCETCENLVCVATTIGQLQHTEYLKPTFLDTFKWAIRPVFPETVTLYVVGEDGRLLSCFSWELGTKTAAGIDKDLILPSLLGIALDLHFLSPLYV